MPLCVYNGAFQVVLVVKNPPAIAGDLRDMNLIPGSGRSPAEGNGNPFHSIPVQSIPVFVPGKSHGQRSLAGYTVHGVSKSQTWLRDWAHMQRGQKSLKKGWNSLAGHTCRETESSVYCDHCCLQALPSLLLSGANGSYCAKHNSQDILEESSVYPMEDPFDGWQNSSLFFFFSQRILALFKMWYFHFYFLTEKQRLCNKKNEPLEAAHTARPLPGELFQTASVGITTQDLHFKIINLLITGDSLRPF